MDLYGSSRKLKISNFRKFPKNYLFGKISSKLFLENGLFDPENVENFERWVIFIILWFILIFFTSLPSWGYQPRTTWGGGGRVIAFKWPGAPPQKNPGKTTDWGVARQREWWISLKFRKMMLKSGYFAAISSNRFYYKFN